MSVSGMCRTRIGGASRARSSSSGGAVTLDGRSRRRLSEIAGGVEVGQPGLERHLVDRQRVDRVRRLGRRAQRVQQLLAAAAAPGQHQERVVVERLGQHVEHRRHVLAGHAQSGQVHIISMRDGNSGSPSRRRPPRSRAASRRPAARARYSACAASDRTTVATVARRRRRSRSRPRTGPAASPAPGRHQARRHVKSMTWPLRAYVRPRASRPPSQISSRTSTNRRDHHCSPILPRWRAPRCRRRPGSAGRPRRTARPDRPACQLTAPGRARTARAAGRWTAR